MGARGKGQAGYYFKPQDRVSMPLVGKCKCSCRWTLGARARLDLYRQYSSVQFSPAYLAYSVNSSGSGRVEGSNLPREDGVEAEWMLVDGYEVEFLLG